MAVSSRRVNAQTRRELYELHAVLCKAIADPKRLLIINALRDGPKTVTEGGFLMDSREQLRAMRAMEDAGLELGAIYHSHLVEFVVHSMANDADEAGVTPETRESDALWALTWQARRAAWLLRNRRALEHALA